MKDRDLQRNEAKYEYERDKQQVNDIVNRIAYEDLQAEMLEKQKKETSKYYMKQSYKEKEELRLQKLEKDRLEKEAEKLYFANVAKREAEVKEKKAAVQQEKDQMYKQLCEEKARKQEEQDYWENVRNELYVEELNRKSRIKELEEQQKKQKQKELMLQSAIEQAETKEARKMKEKEDEAEFKKRLLEKFKEDERLEQYNLVRRKQKELDFKMDIEKQWQEKLMQYKLQKEAELYNLKKCKEDEAAKSKLIEYEKVRLIRENEEILKTYMAKEYGKKIKGM